MIYKSRWYFFWIPNINLLQCASGWIAKLHSLVEGAYNPLTDFSVTTCPKWHGHKVHLSMNCQKGVAKWQNIIEFCIESNTNCRLTHGPSTLYKLLFHAKLLVGNDPDEMALTRLTNESNCWTSFRVDMNPSNCGFNTSFQTSLFFKKDIHQFYT